MSPMIKAIIDDFIEIIKEFYVKRIKKKNF